MRTTTPPHKNQPVSLPKKRIKRQPLSSFLTFHTVYILDTGSRGYREPKGTTVVAKERETTSDSDSSISIASSRLLPWISCRGLPLKTNNTNSPCLSLPWSSKISNPTVVYKRLDPFPILRALLDRMVSIICPQTISVRLPVSHLINRFAHTQAPVNPISWMPLVLFWVYTHGICVRGN